MSALVELVVVVEACPITFALVHDHRSTWPGCGHPHFADRRRHPRSIHPNPCGFADGHRPCIIGRDRYIVAGVLDGQDLRADLLPVLENVVDAGHPMQRIVVVDDDPLIRMIIDKTLDKDQREFVMTGSIKEARASIDATTDLVLLDLLLPGGDGCQ